MCLLSSTALTMLHSTYACLDWDSQGQTFQLTPNRGCTDILFLLLWILFWSGAVCGANSDFSRCFRFLLPLYKNTATREL